MTSVQAPVHAAPAAAHPQPGHALVTLERVNVQLGGSPILHDVTWRLTTGEHWAVLGPNGSGKSTLLKLVRGELWPAPVDGGIRSYNLDGHATRSPIGVRQRIALVSAEQQTRYQRKDWDLRAWQVVYTGLSDSDLIYQHATPAQRDQVFQAMAQLGIAELDDADFKTLSQGQLRKVLIARALVRHPQVLICDEIGVGLDPAARHQLHDVIERAARTGTQVLMTTHRHAELIPSITHVMLLKDGRITRQGRREDVLPAPRHAPHVGRWARATTSTGTGDVEPSSTVVRIRNAAVALAEGSVLVLRDLNWHMQRGEHWLIYGPNGAGKTSLLRLILGELHTDVGGDIRRFGEGAFDNVWQIKQRIGYVSPELQARYAVDLPARDVIATGFFSSIGWMQRVSRAQRARVNEVLDLFGLRPLADRSLLHMSYGQARKVLIARALATRPQLVLLDEPFDGLDPDFRAELAAVLDAISSETSIILVSHHEGDCLPCITHRMRLEHGRIAALERRVRRIHAQESGR